MQLAANSTNKPSCTCRDFVLIPNRRAIHLVALGQSLPNNAGDYGNLRKNVFIERVIKNHFIFIEIVSKELDELISEGNKFIKELAFMAFQNAGNVVVSAVFWLRKARATLLFKKK